MVNVTNLEDKHLSMLAKAEDLLGEVAGLIDTVDGEVCDDELRELHDAAYGAMCELSMIRLAAKEHRVRLPKLGARCDG